MKDSAMWVATLLMVIACLALTAVFFARKARQLEDTVTDCWAHTCGPTVDRPTASIPE